MAIQNLCVANHAANVAYQWQADGSRFGYVQAKMQVWRPLSLGPPTAGEFERPRSERQPFVLRAA